MKFLNFESNGFPIATIKSSNKKLNNKIIHLDDKSSSMKSFNHIKLEGDDRFQLIPNDKIERSINYVCGSSGSGKTFWIKQFLQEYKKVFPKNEIYLFSPFDEHDISFDGVKVTPIKIDEELLQDQLSSKDFENSLLCFDDIESISSAKLRKEVHRIMDNVLTQGRHFRVSACCVMHEACNGIQTKKLLNESNAITTFPKNMGGRSMKYLFENYLGLDKDEIKKLKKLKTRPLTIVKGYPRIAISEKELICLGCDDSDSDSDSDSDIEMYKRKKKSSK